MKKMIAGVILLILGMVGIVSYLVRQNTDIFTNGRVTIDGVTYETEQELRQFMNRWTIDYQGSGLKKEKLFRANQEDDVLVKLCSKKNQMGVQVVLEHHGKTDIHYEKGTVSEIIVVHSREAASPKVRLGDRKLKWNWNREELEAIFGKASQVYEEENEIRLQYGDTKSSHGVSFFLMKKKGLNKVMIY